MSDDNFEHFEEQFESDPTEQNYQVIDAGLGAHIFDLWEHLCMHFAEAGIEAKRRGSDVAGGTYMLPNGVTLSFLYADHNNIYVWAQYPQDVVERAIAQLVGAGPDGVALDLPRYEDPT